MGMLLSIEGVLIFVFLDVLQYGRLRVAKGKGRCEKIFAQKRRFWKIAVKSERDEEGLRDGMKKRRRKREETVEIRT